MNKSAIAAFHTRLHRWYRSHGRHDLPWRNTPDPYAIYISEVMLQQTQVATVLERYYGPFLKRFPTLSALADAPRKDVLSAWQGLGYYNRAANLHAAAIASKGALPNDVESLMALPGIGRNTAHAVAAFAFRLPVAVMEANVKRVLCRIFALTTPSDKELWENAALLLDTKEPFDYNQAMMDIGATICTKRNPKCEICPAQPICEGQTSPESYPAAKAKKVTPVRRKNILLLRDAKGRYFAKPRETRFLHGLYHFIEMDADQSTYDSYSLKGVKPLGDIRQQYSHFTLEARVYVVDAKKSSGADWYALPALKKLPFSMAEQKILALLK